MSRRREFEHKITCLTPLKRLPWFTDLIIDHLRPFDDALLIIDQIVFEPVPALESLRAAVGEQRPIREAPGRLFERELEGFKSALSAALSEWIDLRALFSSPRHALLADHDEYTTLFSNSPGDIANARRALLAGGVEIADYTAQLP